jgi:enoyl-CoA hydratase/carnithine racemase
MKYATLNSVGPVSVVTLNRPERLNALGSELLRDFHEAMVSAQADTQTRVILLTGAGRAFCAGDDLKEFEEQTTSPEAIASICNDIQQITRDIMFGNKLVVGAIHGYAVGGGFEWMLNCDLVVAAEDLVCFFPEMQLGHFVTGGVTHLLPQTIGYQRAMELVVLGDRVDASRLHQLGLVNRVVPKEKLLETAMAMANAVASRSAFSTGLLKKTLTSQLSPFLSSALELERQAAMSCFGNADTAERIQNFTSKKWS